METSTKKEIGMLIPEYLRKNKISVQKFADEMNVSRRQVYRWIHGISIPNSINYLNLLSVLRAV